MNCPIRTATIAIAAAAVALASPAVATAEPKEWDIGAYDQCVGSFNDNPNESEANHKRWVDHMKMCCVNSGGIYKYAGAGGCVAPPKDQQEFTPDRPGLADVPTATLTPDPIAVPPGSITEAP